MPPIKYAKSLDGSSKMTTVTFPVPPMPSVTVSIYETMMEEGLFAVTRTVTDEEVEILLQTVKKNEKRLSGLAILQTVDQSLKVTVHPCDRGPLGYAILSGLLGRLRHKHLSPIKATVDMTKHVHENPIFVGGTAQAGAQATGTGHA